MRVWMVAWLTGWALLLAACVTLQETGQSKFIISSPQQEAAMGAASFQELKQSTKISTDANANAQVNRVMAKLIPTTGTDPNGWEVIVIDDPSPNAFALPGGKVGVHTGILPLTQTDDGLAAVLGHELAHVTLRHGGQRMTQQMGVMLGYNALGIALQQNDYRTRQLWMTAAGVGSQVFLTLPFSRDHEYEADRIGLRYMAKAGYNPNEAIGFWQRMQQAGGSKPPEFLSTHPSDEHRIEQIRAELPAVLPYYSPNR